MFAAIIFDVEGTLIDCVSQILASWQTGHQLSRHELQRYSGMDGCDMLDHLLPAVPKKQKQHILNTQGEIYRREYLRLGPVLSGLGDNDRGSEEAWGGSWYCHELQER